MEARSCQKIFLCYFFVYSKWKIPKMNFIKILSQGFDVIFPDKITLITNTEESQQKNCNNSKILKRRAKHEIF